ncbi:hypothetical protein B0H19DRAFT_1055413 [Mycena capillaripes]|nr:hypothetical protein B0H19DRAFT_1055413 [Mycena capillaripes]
MDRKLSEYLVQYILNGEHYESRTAAALCLVVLCVTNDNSVWHAVVPFATIKIVGPPSRTLCPSPSEVLLLGNDVQALQENPITKIREKKMKSDQNWAFDWAITFLSAHIPGLLELSPSGDVPKWIAGVKAFKENEVGSRGRTFETGNHLLETRTSGSFHGASSRAVPSSGYPVEDNRDPSSWDWVGLHE